MLQGFRRVREATIRGTLYDLGPYPAAVLRGLGEIHGEIWAGPLESLGPLDRYEGVGEGLFSRVRLELADGPCWTYTAGPRLEPLLLPSRRVHSGRWERSST